MNEGNNSLQQRSATLLRILVGILSIASVFIVVAIPVTIYQISQPVTVEWESEVWGPPRSFVWAVALDPLDPGTIYAGTNGGGIYKSADNGMTWDQKNDGMKSLQGPERGVEHARDIRDILVSRTQPGVIYVATWGPEGIYRSDDGGETWMMQIVDVFGTDDEADLALIDESVYVRVLLETETTIFAGTNGGVFQLIDPDDILWQLTGLKGEGMSIRAMLADPRTPQTLYAATLGQGIYKSEDGGETWQEKNNGLGNEVALEVNALIFDPENPDVMYAGTLGNGVYRSLDGGESWDAWSDGLPEESDVWSLHFAADGTLFVGLRFRGTYKRTELEEWKKANFLSGALTLEVDSQTGAIYAGTWGGGLYRNENGQDESPHDWQNLKLPGEYPRLRAAVFVPPTLYVGTDSDGIYVSQNGGQDWERWSQGLEGESLAIRALATTPDGYTLYAGTGAGVFVSADGGQQWDPLGDNPLPDTSFSIASLAVDGYIPGEQGVIYAGMEHAGLWTFDRNQQQWDGPQEFEYRTGVRTDVSVQSLLVRDRAVYASLWGLGVYKSPTEGPWPSVEMSPKYVDTLTLADKTWLQWGGAQFYALTERGLYGSRDGRDWKPLYGALEAITADPLHPQVAYASVTLDTQSSNEENDLDATSPMTSTAILVSLNDGRDWQDVDSIEGHVVTHLVRDPGDPHRIFALVADGGLYRGTVRLPWLVREAVSWWLVGIISLLIFVVAPYGYFNLLRTYDLPSHRLARGLLARFWLLRRVRSQRFQNLLKPMAKLILATMDQTQFGLVEVWEKLDEIGVSTSRSRLMSALNDLAGYGLLKEQGDRSFRYTTPGLQNVAAVELRESEDALIEPVRRENRLLDNIERFFEQAGFDVRQDAPRHLTKFVLRHRRSLYRDYRQLHAWLRIQKPLQTIDVDIICQETIQEHTPSTPGDDSATHPVPVAFFVVTELPKVEAFRQMRIRQEQVRLIPLSTMTIHSALREHSAIRDLDMLVQQERSQTNLYDIRAPITDRMDFFGRQDKIDTLEKELQEGRSVDVWGLPGIGKSSLLWHLKDTLVNPVAAYADLEYGWQGETSFHKQIISDLTNDLWLKYSRFLDEETDDFEKQLLSIAQTVPAGEEHDVQIVLLLDGVSAATGDSAQWRTLEHLRHLADNHPNLATVMTWQDPEVTVDAWKPLGTLDEKNSQQLITTIGVQMGLDFSQGSLVNIHRETGGHPFLVRQLGSAIAQQSPARAPTKFVQVTPVWVDRALSHYRLTRDYYFEDVWQWCSPNQKKSLRAWSAMTGEEQELLLSGNPYLRELMQSHETLSDLFIAWILEAAEENRL